MTTSLYVIVEVMYLQYVLLSKHLQYFKQYNNIVV